MVSKCTPISIINLIRKMETINKSIILKQAFNLLKYTLVIVTIVAGADKFTNILTNWENYLNPSIVRILPFSPTVFMMIAGTIEIIAGIIVLVKTEFGGYLVAAWLTLIALSLLASFNYADVAVRDIQTSKDFCKHL